MVARLSLVRCGEGFNRAAALARWGLRTIWHPGLHDARNRMVPPSQKTNSFKPLTTHRHHRRMESPMHPEDAPCS